MPQYLSPGVYVEEVKPTAQSVAGVGTSTAGFIGVVPNDVVMLPQPGKFEIDDATKKPKLDAKGNPIPIPYTVAKVGEPKLITSWEEFKNNFGDFQPKKTAASPSPSPSPTPSPTPTPTPTPTSTGWSDTDYDNYRYLQHAVYGFFSNGGTRCWVMRVAAATDLSGVADDLEKFAAIDEIAIALVPGATSSTQHTDILAHCFKLQDRFAVLDGVRIDATANPTPEAIAPTGRNNETGSYGAIYYPWIKVYDPATGQIITVPPSGHIAGIYARNDSTRGVFKAPANEVIVGALDVDRPLSKAHQDGLNPEGINVIRSFNGSIKVWGARTRAESSEFRYISTRRFFNFLRESIDEGTQFAVFEPNTPVLWQRITQTITGFLLNQWRDGALLGTTPEQAFFVKCDKDTNPAPVRELGQVVTEIGVAIVKPAEFVIFRIQQMTGS
ncbi:MAG: hypothetical protein Fur006_37740 [Coleofasciculaceae cyanobacterium]